MRKEYRSPRLIEYVPVPIVPLSAGSASGSHKEDESVRAVRDAAVLMRTIGELVQTERTPKLHAAWLTLMRVERPFATVGGWLRKSRGRAHESLARMELAGPAAGERHLSRLRESLILIVSIRLSIGPLDRRLGSQRNFLPLAEEVYAYADRPLECKGGNSKGDSCTTTVYCS